jgi:hypothetical protein
MMTIMQMIGGAGKEKQAAPPAPAFQPGFGPGNMTPGIPNPLNVPQLQPNTGLLDALGSLTQQNAATSPVDESFKDQSLADIDDGSMEKKPGGFGGFLAGLDKGLQSPAQMLGLGLLGQMGGENKLLPLAGLLGMGLYNRNK